MSVWSCLKAKAHTDVDSCPDQPLLQVSPVMCRNQTIPYELTYPTQNISTINFGTWPVLYEGIDCPTGNMTLQYHFLNVSTVVRGAVGYISLYHELKAQHTDIL